MITPILKSPKNIGIHQILFYLCKLHYYGGEQLIICEKYVNQDMLYVASHLKLTISEEIDKTVKWKTQYLKNLPSLNLSNEHYLIICSLSDVLNESMANLLLKNPNRLFWGQKSENTDLFFVGDNPFRDDEYFNRAARAFINTTYLDVPIIRYLPSISLNFLVKKCMGVAIPYIGSIGWWLHLLSDSVIHVIVPQHVSILKTKTVHVLSHYRIYRTIDEMRYLVVKPINGLCNRIRAVISAKILSERLNLPLFVYWTYSSGFDDSTWCDLFEPVGWFHEITPQTWFYVKKHAFTVQVDGCNGCYSEVLKDTFHGWNGNQIVMESSIDLRTIEGFCIDYPDYDKEYQRWFDTLIPMASLNKRIESLRSMLPLNTVGVHIRRGDAMNVSYRDMFLKTSDVYFQGLIQQKIHEDRHIYLSTDSQYTWEYYVSKYPSRIYSIEKGVWRKDDMKSSSKKPCQKEAVIDLWVLRSLDEFYGTSHSSFSFHASYKLKP